MNLKLFTVKKFQTLKQFGAFRSTWTHDHFQAWIPLKMAQSEVRVSGIAS
jgi:hypothetical protein